MKQKSNRQAKPGQARPEDIVAAIQKQTERKRSTWKRPRGHGKSNLPGYLKAKSQYEIWAKRFKKVWAKKSANPLPVSHRPWVPGVAEVYHREGDTSSELKASLKKLCTRSQYRDLVNRYPFVV